MSKYEKQLLNKGYRKSVQESYKLLHQSDTLYQKRVSDYNGVRYYINVWWYPERPTGGMGHGSIPESIQPEVQMLTPDGNRVDIAYLSDDIEKAETFFDDTWVELGMEYDDEY